MFNFDGNSCVRVVYAIIRGIPYSPKTHQPIACCVCAVNLTLLYNTLTVPIISVFFAKRFAPQRIAQGSQWKGKADIFKSQNTDIIRVLYDLMRAMFYNLLCFSSVFKFETKIISHF